jgi:hypothetical protein
MNVYFCDICGVRVTDVDLHSGHGMRRRNDVICATCLDLGHGKDWMQKGQAAVQAPVLAAVGAAGADEGRSPQSPIIEVARDRARTVEEDVEPAAVAPVVMRAGANAIAHAIEGVPDLDDDSATAKVPVLDQHLASTAAGFAALGSPVDESEAQDDDDLEETPVPQKPDDTGAEPILPAASGMSPFEKAQDRDDDDADREKEETRIPATPDTEVSRKGSDTLRKSSDRLKAGKSARGKTSVSRSGKPGKGTRRTKASNQQLLIMSAISGVLILIVGIMVIVKAGSHGPKTPERIVEDLTKKIRVEVRDAGAAARSACQSKDPAALTDARSKLQGLQADVLAFDKAARQLGWDDDAVERFLEREVHYQDTKTLLRVVNEELIKQRK